MTDRDRREFLKRAGLALGAWPSLIQSALAVPADRRTGSIMDVEHVVILMQEIGLSIIILACCAAYAAFPTPDP